MCLGERLLCVVGGGAPLWLPPLRSRAIWAGAPPLALRHWAIMGTGTQRPHWPPAL